MIYQWILLIYFDLDLIYRTAVRYNKRHVVANEGLSPSRRRALWTNAHDWHESVCLVERSRAGDETRNPHLLQSGNQLPQNLPSTR